MNRAEEGIDGGWRVLDPGLPSPSARFHPRRPRGASSLSSDLLGASAGTAEGDTMILKLLWGAPSFLA